MAVTQPHYRDRMPTHEEALRESITEAREAAAECRSHLDKLDGLLDDLEGLAAKATRPNGADGVKACAQEAERQLSGAVRKAAATKADLEDGRNG